MMHERIIRLCYRKIIDAHTAGMWENYVFEDTYQEFLLQAQYFNQEKKYTSFSDIIHYIPNADRLHFLVSAAAVGYLKQLNGKVPDILNNLGRLFLPFSNFRFEIIHSDIKDKSKHTVAINFYTDDLIWHDTINNQLLVSVPGNTEDAAILTELFTLQPYLSIYSIKK